MKRKNKHSVIAILNAGGHIEKHTYNIYLYDTFNKIVGYITFGLYCDLIISGLIIEQDGKHIINPDKNAIEWEILGH